MGASVPVRKKFLVPNSLYFLNHSVGCLPRSSRLVAERFFSSWQNFGGEAWDSWFEQIEQFKLNLAKLLKANSPHEICPQTNVSASISKIIGSLPQRAQRKKILIAEQAFPSVGFASQMSAQSTHEIEYINSGFTHEEVLANWLPKLTDNVQLIILNHVLSNNSFAYPVKELIEYAKAKNIYTIVDVAASAGIKPINLAEWDADFVVGTCIKWLCGGPGSGFLWVNNKRIEAFQPTEVGWFSHQDPSELDIHHFEYAPDARRFWGGTPSILPFVIAAESIRTFLEVGMNQIVSKNNLLVERLLQACQLLDIKINSPLSKIERGGTVVIDVPDTLRAKTYFADKGLWVDQRVEGFRISPHVYNEIEEVDEVINILEDLYCRKITVILPGNVKSRRYGHI
jgi:kynureninase